ncbi:hypothetical protein L0F67_00740 [Actinobacillus suis]|uniref:Uncharacterized protein n=1 Tax=Actinobacillus equuli subsp. equuli TaxID=202947 RepID=A0A9X4G2T0_ACTEU|nr:MULTISPECIES: hypothetical protein [Actinobacillus]MCQ9710975.1 hypothetical protein [Actinobacillus suis]MDE8034356.1 hypothetical protein [Actinobacillus equuli subsp. equuli]MDG4949124.1 hypothetical protein [Actinobacillus equuli subsp. haemolyticus]UTH25600.1 hypothetical protein L0F67_00740 [Actinobacillus suis]WGE41503.1 hypothetical protein NYR64_07080 [Actinobacillus equuli subsp. haemolyticus]
MIEVYLLVIPFCFLISLISSFARKGFLKAVLHSLLLAISWPISLPLLVLKRLFKRSH